MPNIIPLPAGITPLPGKFHLDERTVITADPFNAWNAAFLHDLLAPPTGLPLPVHRHEPPEGTPLLRLHIDPSLAALGREGYRLEVQPSMAILAAPSPTGVFYAIQTLRQVLPPAIESRVYVPGVEWSLPGIIIQDQPRFPWRGFMLDEGRHFHGLETVLLTLDLMALQKLNVFHWHLTEDQGWRLQVMKYPRLTEVGAWRRGTSQGLSARGHDGLPHGGFYTQEQVRHVVQYAGERHIQVVPEIEIPGHSLAALASYPDLSCTGGPFEVATRFGIFPDVYCPGKEAVFTFLQDVLNEVLELFPSPFIHIGGDEVPKTRWKNCPDCQRRIRDLGLKNEHALQVHVTNRIADHLASRGRRLVGWNQVLEEGLAPSAVVQYWLGSRVRLVEAIKAGRNVVMSTYLDTYLDHGYSLMSLRRAYRYEPVPREIEESEAGSILGLEFPLWTEWVPNRPRLDYQAYPRLAAMAETGWTSRDKKDYENFRLRLEPFLQRLHLLGVHPAPLAEVDPPWLRRLFGPLTIARPQTRTAGGQRQQAQE